MKRFARIEAIKRPTLTAFYWFAWVRSRRMIRWYAKHDPTALAVAYANAYAQGLGR